VANFFSAGGDLKAFAGFGDAISEKLLELTDYLHAADQHFLFACAHR
jgi:enoyl-CoA hydratase/carnithine racemase